MVKIFYRINNKFKIMLIFPSLEALSAADPFVNKGGASRNLSCPFE